MGSGSSGGGGLAGGKTVLAGTYMAEQAPNSSSYTLVSVGEGMKRKKPGVQAHDNRGDRLRKARVEKGGLQCTKLAALQQIDSLLLPNEEPTSRQPKAAVAAKDSATGAAGKAKATQVGSDETGPACGETGDAGLPTEGETEPSAELQPPPPMEPVPPAGGRPLPPIGSPKKLQYKGGNAPVQERGVSAGAQPSDTGEASFEAGPIPGAVAAGSPQSPPSSPSSPSRRGRPLSRPYSQPGSTASDGTEVFKRLYIAQKPWVAGRTDTQLLQYLAWRGGTPEIASPQRSILTSTSQISSSQSPSRSFRRQYRNHRELFDDCLHRESSPSPPRSPPPGKSESRPQRSSDSGRPRLDSQGKAAAMFSPQRLAKAKVAREHSGRLYDQIEEISIIPQNAVEALFVKIEGEIFD